HPMFLLPSAAVSRFGQAARPFRRLTQMHADERRGNSAWVEFPEPASQRKYSRGLSTSVETTVSGGSLRFRPRIGAEHQPRRHGDTEQDGSRRLTLMNADSP